MMFSKKGTYPALRPAPRAKATKPKDERTPERKAFDLAVRGFDRKLNELAQAAVEHTERYRMADSIRKAADRAQEKFRRLGLFEKAEDLYEALGSELRGKVRAATESSAAAYQKFLESEHERITKQMRADRARQGGYEKELELMRGRK